MTWPAKKLAEVLALHDNGIWGPKDLEKGISILRSTNFNDDGTINLVNVALRKVENAHLEEKKLQKGDILLERSGGGPQQPVGRVVYFDIKGGYYFGNFLTRLRPKKGVYPKFLFQFLFNVWQKGITNILQNRTTGIRNLQFKEYLNLEIPLPPLQIQKQIAGKIEELFEKIDKAKKLREEAIEQTEILISSALNQILSRGERERWRIEKLGKIVSLETKRNEDKRLPFIGMEDIESNTGKLLTALIVKKIKSSTFYFNNLHVIYGKLRPYLNKVFLPHFEGQCSTEFIPLKPDNSCLIREWLAHWLRFPGTVTRIMQTVTGTRMPRANMDELLGLEIPVPPVPEQHHIVRYLDSIQSGVESLKRLQHETQKEMEDLKKSILDRAFKGELV